ncbi:iron transporter [Microvirga ossetica]|uniref:Iron transporter n=1 Tax=Microvirga ossetica TaxID=1882682 RepID=A0A1B2EAY4_9HYPH|nr:divalent metal cation transporter [Microvirga ossetica]ANY77121.1 iron transporter [Microvirga ossetica]
MEPHIVDDDPEDWGRTPGSKRPRLFRLLGPGLITGASDDDPSGIATYSQAGAQFGYMLTWTMLFSYPLMTAVQMICARLGRTTGHGIAGVLRTYYSNWLLQVIVILLLIANTINLAADLGAMADAVHLLLPGPPALYVVVFAAVCVSMQVFLQYTQYVAVLKWLTLALFAYFAVMVTTHIDWAKLASGLLLPAVRWDKDYLTVIVAVFGTTISPYLFFWQSAEEVEDIGAHPGRHALIGSPEQGNAALQRIRIDTLVGMALSNLVALAIMVTTAATLNVNGITDIQTSSQAAEALRPIAGRFAYVVFALGIIGTGLLSVPVLAGSAAYAIGEARGWSVGFSRRPMQAKSFYGTVALATLIGTIIDFSEINPIKALFWSAVVNGVIAVPVMATMMLVTCRSDIMGPFAVRGWLQAVGWIATGVMTLAALAMFITSF